MSAMAKLLAFLRTAARGTARKRGSSTVAGGFEQLGVDNWLAERVASQGITTPTEVQNKSLPELLTGRHVVVNAETGSGKTLCYLLPVLQALHRITHHGRTPYALVLVPSPELATQVSKVYDDLVGNSGLSSVLHSQCRLVLKPNTQLLAATPNTQLLAATPNSLVQYGVKKILKPVRIICCDEADILLTGGESKATWTILKTVRELYRQDVEHTRRQSLEESSLSASPSVAASRQLIFAAATLPCGGRKTVDSMLRNWLPNDAVFISTSQAHHVLPSAKFEFTVIQSSDHFREMEDKLDDIDYEEMKEYQNHLFECKISHLLQDLESLKQTFLSSFSFTHSTSANDTPRVLLFCNKVETTTKLYDVLTQQARFGHWWSGRVGQLHKGVTAEERMSMLDQLQNGNLRVVVCTDIASRGLDFHVTDVIQFDFPGNSADFLHRAGRTARAGRSGRVLSYVTSADQGIAGEIKHVLESQTGRTFADIFSRNRMLRRKIKARRSTIPDTD